MTAVLTNTFFDPGQLVNFIAAVIGILVPAVTLSTVIRRAMSRRAEKPAAQPAPTVLMGASPSTGGPSSADAPCPSVASYVAASRPTTTITFKSKPEWYEIGVRLPTPSGESAKGGCPVYPAGL